MSRTLTPRVGRAVTRLGLEPRVADLLAISHPRFRRDRRDNDNLALLLASTLRRDSNAVDIGANRGDILRQFVALAPGGHHFAFEPLPELADALRQEFAGVAVHELALTDSIGTDSFTRAAGAEGYSKLGAPPAHGQTETFEVRTATLDSVLPRDLPIDFIKIDTEGSELFVVEGAARTLARWRPTLWIEHGRTADGYRGTRSTALWDVLCTQHEYRLFTADGHGPLERDQLQPGVLPGMMWNWLAVAAKNPGARDD